jgi:hypothetical protein
MIGDGLEFDFGRYKKMRKLGIKSHGSKVGLRKRSHSIPYKTAQGK